MKALAVAVLGLAGMGSAMAACSNATPFAAWSSWNPAAVTCHGVASTGCNTEDKLGGISVAADGLHSTACSMSSKFTTRADQGGSFGEEAGVFDNSPQKEQSYRFRFYINPAGVASTLTSANQVGVFGAHSASNHGVTPNNQIVQMYILGNGASGTNTNVFLRTFAACTSGDGFQGSRCSVTDVQLPTASFATGVRVEGQVILGASGKVNIWVGSAVDPNTPSAVINLNNAAWGGSDGVKQSKLGLQTSTLGYQKDNQNKIVLFDEFDSRRQTFIGL